jgi:hypothetical protein
VNFDRPLALVSVGGVVLLAFGAVVAGGTGWPTTDGGTVVSSGAWLLVAALLLAAAAGATLWGVRTAPGGDDTPYWND